MLRWALNMGFSGLAGILKHKLDGPAARAGSCKRSNRR